jgi:uncharacterized protein (TIRG00374 family)
VRLGSRGRRGLGAVFAVAFVVVVFAVVLPRLASYRDVAAATGGLTWLGAVALALAVVANIVTFAPPWMAALPGLGFWRSLTMTQAATAAASVFPGGEAVGIALSVGMLRAWGFRARAVTLATIVVSVFNQLAKLSFPLLALAGLFAFGEVEGPLAVAAAIGFAVFLVVLGAAAAALVGERQARWIGERAEAVLGVLLPLLRRDPPTTVGDRLVRFRADALTLLRRRGAAITVATFGGHLAQFLVLVIALRALGVERAEVNVLEAFAAWALVRLLTAAPITPGGIGIVELGLSTSLIASGGDRAEVVAAVLVYRLLTWVPSIAIGVPAALLWRRVHPAAAEPVAVPALHGVEDPNVDLRG